MGHVSAPCTDGCLGYTSLHHFSYIGILFAIQKSSVCLFVLVFIHFSSRPSLSPSGGLF